jgi:hypothetical protein
MEFVGLEDSKKQGKTSAHYYNISTTLGKEKCKVYTLYMEVEL